MPRLSDELQIEIDDSLGCPGRCPGCVLSADERRTRTPDMPLARIALAVERLIDYAHGLKGLRKINLTFGIADHGGLPVEHLVQAHAQGVRLLNATGLNDGHNAVFMTFAMIGKHAHVLERLKALRQGVLDHGTPLIPIVVLDPGLFYHARFGEDYVRNIEAAHTIFGRIDLAINLSEEAVQRLAPAVLHAFARDRGFEEVTVNWTPTHDNLPHTYRNMDALGDWLLAFDALVRSTPGLGCSYGPVLRRALDAAACGADDDALAGTSLTHALADGIGETVLKSVQIDHEGRFFPKFEAIGDIPHHPRFGLPVMGSIDADLREQADRALPGIQRTILRALSGRACSGCTFRNACALTGFHVINHVVRSGAVPTLPDAQGCVHPGRRLFEDQWARRHEWAAAVAQRTDGHALPVAA